MRSHRSRPVLVSFLAVPLAVAPAARATTWYVAPSGDDANPGSEAAPWATLQHAADEVSPGDEVRVADGEYGTVVVETSGTESAPIVFRATGDAARIGPAVPDGDGIVIRASWITFEGFGVADTGQHCVSAGPAGPDGVLEGVRLVGLSVTGCVADGIRLERTVRATVDGCVVHDVGGDGISLAGSARALVQNNAVWGGRGDGIVLTHDPGLVLPTDATVVNNTVLRTGTAGWALRLAVPAGQGMTGNVVFNNVLLAADDAAGSIALGEGDAGLASARNAVSDRFGVGATTRTLAEFQDLGYESSSLLTEPSRLFRDTASSDLRLRAGCPAVNVGLPTFAGRSAPDHDLLGVRRPVGGVLDLGAYEFCIADDCTGEAPDAGTDAGVDTGTDAAADTPGGGGCGCRAAGRPGDGGAAVLFGVLPAALRRRRFRTAPPVRDGRAVARAGAAADQARDVNATAESAIQGDMRKSSTRTTAGLRLLGPLAAALALLFAASAAAQVVAADAAAAEEVLDVPVPAWSPSIGPADAPVTLVVFLEYLCPFCRRLEPVLAQLRTAYGDRIRIVYRFRTVHPGAEELAVAALAAHRQGKFRAFHERLFENQERLREQPQFPIRLARELGLDVERFRADLRGALIRKQVAADAAEADRLRVNGVPTTFINGRRLSGAVPAENFGERIDRLLGIETPTVFPTPAPPAPPAPTRGPVEGAGEAGVPPSPPGVTPPSE